MLEKSTFYVIDAQGNTMSVYERVVNATNQSVTFEQTEKHIYSSSRLGVMNVKIPMLGSQNVTYSMMNKKHVIGERTYELANHLGNVLNVVTDRKLANNGGSGSVVAYYTADVVSFSDYNPFGMLMPGRHEDENGYKFGFNGKEKLDELHGNSGDSYDFGARMLDVRLGRWLTIDPLASKYPDLSPYTFVSNSPILFIDPDGKQIIINYKDEKGNPKSMVYTPGLKPETSNAFVQQVHEAVSYAMKSDASNTYLDISKSTEIVTINEIGTDKDETIGKIGSTKVTDVSINWNPNIALETTNGGALSPATALLHEAAHAERFITTDTKAEVDALKRDLVKNSMVYDNLEEKRVIDKIETPYIKAKNIETNKNLNQYSYYTSQVEGTRIDHRGTTYVNTGGVTSITPKYSHSVKGQVKVIDNNVQPAVSTGVRNGNSTGLD